MLTWVFLTYKDAVFKARAIPTDMPIIEIGNILSIIIHVRIHDNTARSRGLIFILYSSTHMNSTNRVIEEVLTDYASIKEVGRSSGSIPILIWTRKTRALWYPKPRHDEGDQPYDGIEPK